MNGLRHIAICGAHCRYFVGLMCMILILATAGTTILHAQSATDVQLNPTKRIIEMIVPLHYGTFYLGDLPVRLTPSQEVEIERDALIRALKELLRPEALEALKTVGDKDAPHCSLSQLQKKGFALSFDPGEVIVKFAPTVEQKQKGNISVQARQAPVESANLVPTADVAGFINIRSAMDYLDDSAVDKTRLTAPRFDFEGSARWWDLVLEAEATFEPDDIASFGRADANIKRRGTRLIRDFNEKDIRLTVGDVYPIGTGSQLTPDMLGFSLEHSQAKLRPGRSIRSTSTHSFRLERPSNIDIIVNGQVIRQLRLDAGDYDIGDLPIASGANDVVLEIRDDVGNARQLQFSLFRDDSLLSTGTAEWALAAGLPSDFDDGEPDYKTDDHFLSGFYRRGLTDQLTGEGHLQMDRQTIMAGSGMLFGRALGLFAMEGVTSLRNDSWGYALSADYALTGIEDSQGTVHNFRLSGKLRSPDFVTPGSGATTLDQHWLSLSAAYSRRFPFDIAAYFSTAYFFGREEEFDRYSADISLSRSFGSLAIALSAGYAIENDHIDDLSLLFRLRYDLDDHGTLSTVHDVGSGRSSLSYARQDGEGIGRWQTNIDVTHQMSNNLGGHGDDDMAVTGSLHYTGNRGNIAVSQDARFTGFTTDTIDKRTSVRGEVALAYADGHVAVGRPIANGFAIIHPHESLQDNAITIGQETNGTARTDIWGPALLPALSPQSLNRVQFDVDDIPPGYDLGTNTFDMHPSYKSGYALRVGSAYTVSAFGTLLDMRGKPIALLTGKASEDGNPGKQIEIFTNRAGRFAAQGLAPGRWIIEMASDPVMRFALIVPEKTVGLYRAGELRPLQSQ